MEPKNQDPKTFTVEEWAAWANALIDSKMYRFETRSGYQAFWIRAHQANRPGKSDYITYTAFSYGQFEIKNWKRSLKLVEIVERDQGGRGRRVVDLDKDVVPVWCFEKINLPAQTK